MDWLFWVFVIFFLICFQSRIKETRDFLLGVRQPQPQPQPNRTEPVATAKPQPKTSRLEQVAELGGMAWRIYRKTR
jgi:hypothetical protein